MHHNVVSSDTNEAFETKGLSFVGHLQNENGVEEIVRRKKSDFVGLFKDMKVVGCEGVKGVEDAKVEEHERVTGGKELNFVGRSQNKRGVEVVGCERKKSDFVRRVKDSRLERCEGFREKWIKYYSSSHKILLVGEGDFSFSACLAKAFGSANNMVATSLDCQRLLKKNYKNAIETIKQLEKRGCTVLHQVDATKMADNPYIKRKKFDRIIFNFPIVDFNRFESRSSQIWRNKFLVKRFFMNAKTMLSEKGEIHVVQKCNDFFLEWKMEELACKIGLRLIQELPFRQLDYPGYRTMYGCGGDGNFSCVLSRTYKFGLKSCK